MNTSPLAERLRNAGLSSKVVVPADLRYDSARRIWNGLADKFPAAVVKASSADDVVRTIEVASQNNALLAVRCGGHSLPGFSTCDGGIVLDLSAMKEITVNPITRTANVAGGSLLGELDRAGAPHGLVVPAGVVSHTGVAGLTLGGGMGWLSRRYGLTIDSLTSVDLITATGAQVHASADIEPELYWGVRGGGGNFGVVTKFSYQMHPLGPVSVGSWQYPIESAASALKRLHELGTSSPRELTIGFNIAGTALSVTAFWSGSERLAGEQVLPFGALAKGAAGNHGRVDFTAHQSRHDDFLRWGRRYYAKGGFFGDLTDDVIDRLVSTALTMPTADTDIYVIQLGGAVSDVSDAATAYTGRAAKYYWLVSPVWDNPEQDGTCISWGRRTAAEFSDLSLSGNYVNEQGDIGRDVAVGAYGTEKYGRLQKLKSRFDPGNLFRLNQNIEPAA